MRTLQDMKMKTEYMMEQMRINAINDTLEKFKEVAKHYYETSEGGNLKNLVQIWNMLRKLIYRFVMKFLGYKNVILKVIRRI